MPQTSSSAVRTIRMPKNPLDRAAAALGPVPASSPVVAAPPPKAVPDEPQELNLIGPRKLIRPTLPEGAVRDRRFSRREDPLLPWHSPASATSHHEASSHAEAFYFQKQMQSQTTMVFVLDDGEKIEGLIEWYDRNSIKVRCTQRLAGRPGDGNPRVLIYKSGIKYLYKAGENLPSM